MKFLKTSNMFYIQIISCLCYFFCGSLVTTLGVFISAISHFFQIDAAELSYVYTFLNAGIFVAIVLSGKLLKSFNLKRLLMTSCISVILAIFALTFYHTIYLYAALIFIMGFIGGLLLSFGTHIVITTISDIKVRASRLILMDFFFSFSGIAMPSLFGALLSKNVEWFLLYNFLLIPCVFLLMLSPVARFPVSDDNQNIHATEKWNSFIYLSALGSFLFIFAELMFVLWLVKFLEFKFAISLVTASLFVTLYWLSKAIGLFINQFTVLKLGLRLFLFGSTLIATIAMIILTQSHAAHLVLTCLMFLGFADSGLYSAFIAFASSQVQRPTANLTSFMITSSTLGTLLSAIVSGFVVQHYGLQACINFIVLMYFTLFLVSGLMLRKANPAEMPSAVKVAEQST